MIDLHMHTNVSDGTDSPIQLLEKVAGLGISYFSVTDHDTFISNEIILNEISKRESEFSNIKFITGVEMASVFQGRNLHLLCYGFDEGAESMRSLVESGTASRKERVVALIEHLENAHGIVIPKEKRDDILSRETAGKVHIANAAIESGISMSISDFIHKFLDDLDTRGFKLEAERVIEATHKAGGLVSFAHPIEVQKEYGIDYLELSRMCLKLKSVGLDAIEAYHSLHSKRDIAAYKWIAFGKEIAVSGGSDYHGGNKSVKLLQLSNCDISPADEEITIIQRLFGEE